MHFAKAIAFWFILTLSSEAWAEDAVGIAMISLPEISERPEIGFVYAGSTNLESSFLGIVDFFSFDLFLFPTVKLIDPPYLVIQNEQATLKKGNALEFESKDAALMIASPRFGSCFFQYAFCVKASPLSLPIFSGGGQLRVYSSPIVGAEFHWSGHKRRGWYSSVENIVLQNQTLLTTGLAF